MADDDFIEPQGPASPRQPPTPRPAPGPPPGVRRIPADQMPQAMPEGVRRIPAEQMKGGEAQPSGFFDRIWNNLLQHGNLMGREGALETSAKMGQQAPYRPDLPLRQRMAAMMGKDSLENPMLYVMGTTPNVGGSASAMGADAAALAQRGVRLSPGQAMGMQGPERSLQAFPILQTFVRSAVDRSVDGFDRAATRQALEPIGAVMPRSVKAGHDMMRFANDAITKTYDRLLPHLSLNRQGVQNALNDPKIQQMISELSDDHARRLSKMIDNRLLSRFDQNGQMAGDVLKRVESFLSKRSDSFSRSTVDADLGDALDQILATVRHEIAAQNPQYAPYLSKINESWAMWARLRKAGSRRATAEGVFTPADLLNEIRRSDPSVDHAMFAKGDALMQNFAELGQRVLGRSIGPHREIGAADMILGAPLGAAMAGPYQALRGLQAHPGIPRTAGRAAITATEPDAGRDDRRPRSSVGGS